MEAKEVLSDVLQQLVTSEGDERLTCYQKLNDILKTSQPSDIQDDVLELCVPLVLNDLKVELSSVKEEALQILSCLLKYLESDGKVLHLEEILDCLYDVLLCEKDDAFCCKIFEVMRKFKIQIPEEKLEKLLSNIQKVIENKDKPDLVIGGFNVLRVLVVSRQIQKPCFVPKWLPLLFPFLTHQNQKVRATTLDILRLSLVCALENREKICPLLVDELKNHVVKDLVSLFKNKVEVYVLQVWGYVVTILGEVLHSGTSLINSLLEIVEMAFKSPNVKTRSSAYSAWQQLIDNFALNSAIVSSPKRLKLLLQPLKSSHIRSQFLSMVRCKTWWHLLWCLGERLTPNFEQACLPLLSLCFPNLESSSKPRNVSCIRTIQDEVGIYRKIGQEIIARLLELPAYTSPKSGRSPRIIPQMSIPPLKTPLSQMAFCRHVDILLKAARQALTAQENEAENINEELARYLLLNIVQRVSSLSEEEQKEKSDVVFSFIHFCEVVVKEKLCSVTNLVKTPGLVLLCLLLCESFMERAKYHERFLPIYKRLLNTGSREDSHALEYAHSASRLLLQDHIYKLEPEMCLELWMPLAGFLIEVISETKNANQGNATEHDFSCVVSVLLYPIQRLLPFKLSQVKGGGKDILGVWEKLFLAFAQCASLVPSAELNIACEEICSKFLVTFSEADLENLILMEHLSSVLAIILNSVEHFSAPSKSPLGNSGFSFQNEGKKQQLGNLTSLINVTARITKSLMRMIHQNDEGRLLDKKKVSQTTILINLIEMYSKLFKNSKSAAFAGSLLSNCLPVIATIFELSSQKPCPKIFALQIMGKLEGLLSSIITCMQLYYPGPYNNEILSSLSPLLEATLLHPRRNLRDKMRELWFSTMWPHFHSLKLPDSLKIILRKVHPPLLPGVEISPPEGSSSSENLPENKNESGMQRQWGSFLNRNKDNQNSAVSTPVSPKISKPELTVEDMDSNEFVFIEPVSKSRVLTEHQKEARRSKSFIPALYNDLSQSTQEDSIQEIESKDSQENSLPAIEASEVIPLQDNAQSQETNRAPEENDSSVVECVSKEQSSQGTSDEQPNLEHIGCSVEVVTSPDRSLITSLGDTSEVSESLDIETERTHSEESSPSDCVIVDPEAALKTLQNVDIELPNLPDEIVILSQSTSEIEVPETEPLDVEPRNFARQGKRPSRHESEITKKKRRYHFPKLSKGSKEHIDVDDQDDVIPSSQGENNTETEAVDALVNCIGNQEVLEIKTHECRISEENKPSGCNSTSNISTVSLDEISEASKPRTSSVEKENSSDSSVEFSSTTKAQCNISETATLAIREIKLPSIEGIKTRSIIMISSTDFPMDENIGGNSINITPSMPQIPITQTRGQKRKAGTSVGKAFKKPLNGRPKRKCKALTVLDQYVDASSSSNGFNETTTCSPRSFPVSISLEKITTSMDSFNTDDVSSSSTTLVPPDSSTEASVSSKSDSLKSSLDHIASLPLQEDKGDSVPQINPYESQSAQEELVLPAQVELVSQEKPKEYEIPTNIEIEVHQPHLSEEPENDNELSKGFPEPSNDAEICIQSPTMQALIESPVKSASISDANITINLEIPVMQSEKMVLDLQQSFSTHPRESAGEASVTDTVKDKGEEEDAATQDLEVEATVLADEQPKSDTSYILSEDENLHISVESADSPPPKVASPAKSSTPLIGAKRRKSSSPKMSPIARRLRSRTNIATSKPISKHTVKNKKPASARYTDKDQIFVSTMPLNPSSSPHETVNTSPVIEQITVTPASPEKDLRESSPTNNSGLPRQSPDEQFLRTLTHKCSEQAIHEKQTSPLFRSKRQLCLPVSPLSRSHRILQASIKTYSGIKMQQRQLFKGTSTSSDPQSSPLSPKSSNVKQTSPRRPKHVFSPTASPTSGILKRQKSGEKETSPSTKPRHISFADPLVEYEPSSLPKKYRKSPIGKFLDILDTNRSQRLYESPQEMSKSENASEEDSCGWKSDSSSCSYQETETQEFNTNEIMCPELVDSKDSIKLLLPQLTSSMWLQGLSKIFKLHNINTIGDLSSCVPSKVREFPIRSPKIQVVKNALLCYYNTHRNLLMSKPEISCYGNTPVDDEDPFPTSTSIVPTPSLMPCDSTEKNSDVSSMEETKSSQDALHDSSSEVGLDQTSMSVSKDFDAHVPHSENITGTANDHDYATELDILVTSIDNKEVEEAVKMISDKCTSPELQDEFETQLTEEEIPDVQSSESLPNIQIHGVQLGQEPNHQEDGNTSTQVADTMNDSESHEKEAVEILPLKAESAYLHSVNGSVGGSTGASFRRTTGSLEVLEKYMSTLSIYELAQALEMCSTLLRRKLSENHV